MERNKEYDEFGPWILRIQDREDIPPLFRGCITECDSYRLLLKIPRKIERRNAHPGMDFYDYVVGARDTCLRIWKRAGKNVTEQRVEYRDIVAMKDTHALLKGELVLFMRTDKAVIEYNTVSEKIIQKLINIIEEKAKGSARSILMESIPVEYKPDKAGSIDMLFFNLITEIQTENPDFKLVAHQPDMKMKRTREIRKELKNRKLSLSRTAFVVSDNELLVLEKKLPRRKKAAVYEYSYFYAPLKNITGAIADSFNTDQALYRMELAVNHLKQNYVFESTNAGMLNLVHALQETVAIA